MPTLNRIQKKSIERKRFLRECVKHPGVALKLRYPGSWYEVGKYEDCAVCERRDKKLKERRRFPMSRTRPARILNGSLDL